MVVCGGVGRTRASSIAWFRAPDAKIKSRGTIAIPQPHHQPGRRHGRGGRAKSPRARNHSTKFDAADRMAKVSLRLIERICQKIHKQMKLWFQAGPARNCFKGTSARLEATQKSTVASRMKGQRWVCEFNPGVSALTALPNQTVTKKARVEWTVL
jgi:hypothetical protein